MGNAKGAGFQLKNSSEVPEAHESKGNNNKNQLQVF